MKIEYNTDNDEKMKDKKRIYTKEDDKKKNISKR